MRYPKLDLDTNLNNLLQCVVRWDCNLLRLVCR